MSEYTNIPLGKNVESMDISPSHQPYSGVEIVVDADTSYFSGSRSGRVLRIENPWGTQAQADSILDSLRGTGFQYQPYTASRALLNPASEIGDGVTLNGVYSGLYKISRKYSPLMPADIEAPQEATIDHEYPYEPKQDRIYKRELAEATAQIRLNHDSIEAEVFRASEAEGQLRSSITQNADEISAKVSKSGGSSSSFGWSLTDSAWELQSNGSTVFRATASGIEVSGKITATSGFIGNGANGFTISGSSIYNGMSSLYAGGNGIYIGTDGIALGGGNFRVTSSGSVSATNMTLSGTLNIGGTNITAAALRSGAQTAYDRAGTWNGTTTTVNNNSSYWSTGAGYAYRFNNAAKSSGATPVSAFSCTSLYSKYLNGVEIIMCNGWACSVHTKTINGVTIRYIGTN